MPLVARYLAEKPGTINVWDATLEQQQRDDIDFVWERDVAGKNVSRSVEVKVDSQIVRTHNFAFETISNELYQTPGCFLRSQAHWFIYACAETLSAWVMPMSVVREWFIAEVTASPNRFRHFETFTKVNQGIFYCSIGRLVPVADLEHALGNLVQKVMLK